MPLNFAIFVAVKRGRAAVKILIRMQWLARPRPAPRGRWVQRGKSKEQAHICGNSLLSFAVPRIKDNVGRKKLLILFGQQTPLNSRRHKLGLVAGSRLGDGGHNGCGKVGTTEPYVMLIKLSHAELMQLPGKIIYMQQAQKMSFAFAVRVSRFLHKFTNRRRRS